MYIQKVVILKFVREIFCQKFKLEGFNLYLFIKNKNKNKNCRVLI